LAPLTKDGDFFHYLTFGSAVFILSSRKPFSTSSANLNLEFPGGSLLLTEINGRKQSEVKGTKKRKKV
jgi:hypothetical protein